MIAFLKGTVAAVLPPSMAYIEVGGVGYAVAMPGGDLSKLAVGETATVLTYLSVTENGITLYGFLSEDEKALFEKLIGVSKVGPKMALAGLSTFTPGELADAIATQDIARVSHIPGVGKKTAERIILDLKGTLEAGLDNLFSASAAAPVNAALKGIRGRRGAVAGGDAHLHRRRFGAGLLVASEAAGRLSGPDEGEGVPRHHDRGGPRPLGSG